MAGIRINSNNFNGESVQITFNPFSGGTINLGTQTIPYDYISSNYEGNYSIYIPSADKTCPLQVGTPPSPTPTNTPTPTPSPSFVLECHIEAQNGDFIIAQNGDYIDHFPCPDPSPTPSVTATVTTTPTPTPSSSAPAFDADAAAYLAEVITSGGTVDATMSAATNTLFTDLKSNSLYTKMLAFYPYVGGTASSHAINAKLNKSYDITWNGGMTHGVSGSTGNGTNAYGDPNIIGNDLTFNDYSMGWYQTDETTNVNNSEYMMGVYFGTNNFIAGSNYNSNYIMWVQRNGNQQSANSGNIDGNYIVTRTGTTNCNMIRNTSVVLTETATASSSNQPNPIYLFTMYFGGAYIPSMANKTMAFTFFGDGLSSSEASTLDGIINTFQTSLGRNTY